MSAVSYLAVVVILLAWPANGLLQARFAGQTGGADLTPLMLGVGGALLITLACVVVPLKAGIRRVRSLQRGLPRRLVQSSGASALSVARLLLEHYN
jgi:hypothetical protein